MSLLGTSPLKPSEVALLDVGSVDELIASTPEQWQALQQSSRAQVRQTDSQTNSLIVFPTQPATSLIQQLDPVTSYIPAVDMPWDTATNLKRLPCFCR